MAAILPVVAFVSQLLAWLHSNAPSGLLGQQDQDQHSQQTPQGSAPGTDLRAWRWVPLSLHLKQRHRALSAPFKRALHMHTCISVRAGAPAQAEPRTVERPHSVCAATCRRCPCRRRCHRHRKRRRPYKDRQHSHTMPRPFGLHGVQISLGGGACGVRRAPLLLRHHRPPKVACFAGLRAKGMLGDAHFGCFAYRSPPPASCLTSHDQLTKKCGAASARPRWGGEDVHGATGRQVADGAGRLGWLRLSARRVPGTQPALCGLGPRPHWLFRSRGFRVHCRQPC